MDEEKLYDRLAELRHQMELTNPRFNESAISDLCDAVELLLSERRASRTLLRDVVDTARRAEQWLAGEG